MLIHIGDMAGGHGTDEWEWLKKKGVCHIFKKRFKSNSIKDTVLKQQFEKLGDKLYGKNGWSVVIRSFKKPKVIKFLPLEEEWNRENHTQKKSKKKQLNSD
jgi:hypothetical protein